MKLFILIFIIFSSINCLFKTELYLFNSYKNNENVYGSNFSKFNLLLTHYKTK